MRGRRKTARQKREIAARGPMMTQLVHNLNGTPNGPRVVRTQICSKNRQMHDDKAQ